MARNPAFYRVVWLSDHSTHRLGVHELGDDDSRLFSRHHHQLILRIMTVTHQRIVRIMCAGHQLIINITTHQRIIHIMSVTYECIIRIFS